jgi:Icc-related predicted phosphoesterase
LITHAPCLNTLDLALNTHENIETEKCEICKDVHQGKTHWGDKNLSKEILRIKPKVHVFGHVHDSAGYILKNGILSINASMFVY